MYTMNPPAGRQVAARTRSAGLTVHYVNYETTCWKTGSSQDQVCKADWKSQKRMPRTSPYTIWNYSIFITKQWRFKKRKYSIKLANRSRAELSTRVKWHLFQSICALTVDAGGKNNPNARQIRNAELCVQIITRKFGTQNGETKGWKLTRRHQPNVALTLTGWKLTSRCPAHINRFADTFCVSLFPQMLSLEEEKTVLRMTSAPASDCSHKLTQLVQTPFIPQLTSAAARCCDSSDELT